MSTPKRVLVTGSSGFLGQPITAALVAAGYSVRAASRRGVSFPQGVELAIVPDFRTPFEWTPLLAGIGAVVHVAGLAHADPSRIPQSEFDAINCAATERLAEAASRADVERFVYISSIRAQSGPSARHILTEEDEPRPTDHYGRSKRAAEIAIEAAKIPFTILRPPVVYGTNPKGNMASLMRLALTPWPLPLKGIRARRSLLGMDNLLSAILFVLRSGSTINHTFLVADPEPISIPQIIGLLRTAQGRSPRLWYLPPVLFRAATVLMNRRDLWLRLGEDLVVDCQKLQTFGWRPSHTTNEALRRLVAP